jgi:hypothetical protein
MGIYFHSLYTCTLLQPHLGTLLDATLIFATDLSLPRALILKLHNNPLFYEIMNKQTRLGLEQYLPIFVGSGFGDWHLHCNISSLVGNHNQCEA